MRSEFQNAAGPIQAFSAAEALTKERFVTLGASGVSLADNASARVYTIAVDYASGDSSVKLYNRGQAYLEVNGNSSNIAVGDSLTATTNGIGIKTTTAGDWVGAIALEASTADGDVIPVEFVSHTYPA